MKKLILSVMVLSALAPAEAGLAMRTYRRTVMTSHLVRSTRPARPIHSSRPSDSEKKNDSPKVSIPTAPVCRCPCHGQRARSEKSKPADLKR